MSSPRIVIIGAGIGGLTAGAALAKAGLAVTVLEAHVYPGGCAGTFFHQGYRFDAGATLAGGFYPGGPMDLVATAVGVEQWHARPSELAMAVHLPDGATVNRWSGEHRWTERRDKFGVEADGFWRWQEGTADALWDLALQQLPWPPQTAREALSMANQGVGWMADNWREHLRPGLAVDAFRPVASHLRRASPRMRTFIDGQLLIAAQTTSQHANALFGAAALDLPRRGVVHLAGGMGAIAGTLAAALQRNGGTLHCRQEATRIDRHERQAVTVETKRGLCVEADLVVANLPPWNVASLLGRGTPAKLRKLPALPADAWGAFMVYAGLDDHALPEDFPLHHQVIEAEPMGEANSIFISINPAWDSGRAPSGKRAVTISTHTALEPWWRLYEQDRQRYEEKKARYLAKVLQVAQRAIPGLLNAATLVLPGTPVTFQRFTRRHLGWVGGFPQVDLFRTWAPRLAPNLWLVGDAIFPGQSTAAVALGGLRVANSVLAELGMAKLR